MGEISALIYNFTPEITKLPLQRLAQNFPIQTSQKPMIAGVTCHLKKR